MKIRIINQNPEEIWAREAVYACLKERPKLSKIQKQNPIQWRAERQNQWEAKPRTRRVASERTIIALLLQFSQYRAPEVKKLEKKKGKEEEALEVEAGVAVRMPRKIYLTTEAAIKRKYCTVYWLIALEKIGGKKILYLRN